MKESGYIALTLKFYKDGKRWVSFCEELGTSTFGRSLAEAEERIREAVLLHLNTLEELGERERFFKDNGITLYHHKPKKLSVTESFDGSDYRKSYLQAI